MNRNNQESTEKPHSHNSNYAVNTPGFTKIEKLKDREKTSGKIGIVGRIIEKSGTKVFLKDTTGEIEVTGFEKQFNVGDIIHVKGQLVKKKDDIYVKFIEAEMLTKCKNEWPPKNFNRFKLTGLDSFLNRERREKLKKRSETLKALREFFFENKFEEVDTTVLRAWECPALTPRFRTNYQNDKNQEYILRLSPEEKIKRLTMGFDKVFEIGKCFRNEPSDNIHHPEFTAVEYYQAYSSLSKAIELTENMISTVLKNLNGSTKIIFQGDNYDFSPPITRLKVKDALRKYCNIDFSNDKFREWFKEEDPRNVAKKIESIVEKRVESKLKEPTFLTHYPAYGTLPDKVDPNDEGWVLRAELFAANGIELANLGALNTDPEFLEWRNKQDLHERYSSKAEVLEKLDVDELQELRYGLPPLAGGAIGFDRLMMLITDSKHIKEVMYYPFQENTTS